MAGQAARLGFTLAEVLITLGIIGVVVALTMPALIANHKKQVIANQLKKSYSTISQALTTSISENGDFSEWGIKAQESAGVNYQEKLSTLVKKNIIPYLNVGKDCEYNKCQNAQDVKDSNGTIQNWHSDHTLYQIYLVDGSRMIFFIDSYDDAATGIKYFLDLWVTVDVNGDAGPNEIGKDVFYMVFSSSTQKINMFGARNPRYTLYDNCKNGNRRYCGALIQSDGWQIAKDYPWL